MIFRLYIILKKSLITFFFVSLISINAYKVLSPPITPTMINRFFGSLFNGKFVGISKEWNNFDDISPNVFRAIIAAEDARFFTHHGIDWEAVKQTIKYNKRHKGRKKRGASTITMQTAKNVFLWQGRNYFRKVLEVYFTILIEPIWGKKRILEIYVNIVEFGNGIYGVEAASEKYFHKSSKKLTKYQAALLAAVLPNPHLWSPAHPTKYLLKRVRFIMNRMNGIRI